MTDITTVKKSLEEHLVKREQEITQRRNMLLYRMRNRSEEVLQTLNAEIQFLFSRIDELDQKLLNEAAKGTNTENSLIVEGYHLLSLMNNYLLGTQQRKQKLKRRQNIQIVNLLLIISPTNGE